MTGKCAENCEKQECRITPLSLICKLTRAVLYMFYGKILAHLESVAAPCPFPIASLAAGLDSPACLLLPLLGSAAAAAAAAVADRQVHWTM